MECLVELGLWEPEPRESRMEEKLLVWGSMEARSVGRRQAVLQPGVYPRPKSLPKQEVTYDGRIGVSVLLFNEDFVYAGLGPGRRIRYARSPSQPSVFHA